MLLSVPMASRHDPHAAVRAYLDEVQRNLKSNIAREQTHRRALQNLLEALDQTIDAFNDPQHIEVGAPDFTIRRRERAHQGYRTQGRTPYQAFVDGIESRRREEVKPEAA